MSEPTEETGVGEARTLRDSLEQMREQATREIDRLNRRLVAREQAVEDSVASETERLALQQELTLLRQTLSVKEQALARITDECQRLEDLLEDRNLAFDGLQQAFEQRDSSLRETQRELERMRQEMAWLQKRAYGGPRSPSPSSPQPPRPSASPPTAAPPVARAPVVPPPRPPSPPPSLAHARGQREGRLAIGLVLVVLVLISLAVFLPQLRVWFSVLSLSDGPAELIWAEPPEPPAPSQAAPAVTPIAIAPPPTPTAAPPRAEQMPQLLRDRLADGTFGPELVELPGGSFRMGYNSLARTDHMPAHQVRVDAFLIGAYEVTFADYDRFARASGRPLPDDYGWGRGERPVVGVSWEDASAYVAWLSRASGHRYRLPSEAEWEYAARAGGTGSYWWGFGKEPGRAVCFDCGSEWDRRSTAPIGSLRANPFGLFDTAGNVMEWVADCYVFGYQDAPVDGRPRLDGGCTERVARGGSFSQPATAIRTYARQHFPPRTQLNMLGFRVARDP
ncbi:Sulphatase-modifying factor protein [Marichromatium purpuratum 984]|uniref:Sulphatase-modifying factor protein n=1 Tax=Marichromatium purpuratum 984 TaxID=765910 RepID=W0E0F2_MARPU|nr:formylglycine-generating enzyme family protein [Marichromatium purpuratum]AHF02684.1 Sulphatase-modifying factor protein [Marichromatium purpuratum 984]